MAKSSIPALVSEGTKLKETIKANQARVKEIEGLLIAEGAGDYQDKDGHVAKVIQPSSSVGMPDDLEGAREIAGDSFGKLFDRVITFKPVKSFKEVAAALLTKGKANKLIGLCESAKTAYVKWS